MFAEESKITSSKSVFFFFFFCEALCRVLIMKNENPENLFRREKTTDKKKR